MIEKLNLLLNSVGLLFLVASAGYMSNLLSCGIQNYFTNQMWAKHILVFLTILFYILLFSRDAYKTTVNDEWVFPELFLSAIIIYIVFLLMGKLQPSYVVIILIALCIHMLISIEVENKNADLVKVLDFVQLMISGFVGLVIVIGVVVYVYKQRTEYGKNFSAEKFIFGVPKCAKL